MSDIRSNVVRSDLSDLAAELAAKSGISPELIACFLWNCAKFLGNPLSHEWGATSGYVYLVGDPDNYHLGERGADFRERMRRVAAASEGPDYEGKILARQDAIWGDYL